MRGLVIVVAILGWTVPSEAGPAVAAPWFYADLDDGTCTPIKEATMDLTPQEVAVDNYRLLHISAVFLWNGPDFVILSPVSAPSPGAHDQIFIRGIAKCRAWLKAHHGQHPYTLP